LIIWFTGVANAAVELPNGTCVGAGMTVVVKGGRITAYQYRGKSYPVQRSSDSVYKIGTAGALRVRDPKANKFRAVFALGGHETPATFTCK
jgi:hypothetical protein